MVPKVIHYCWLSGDPYPRLIKQCMKTWKEKLPDYEFLKWDLNRFSFFEDLDFTSRLMEIIPFVYTSDLIKTYRKEFSTLSVSLQPIEKEFAYYLTKERVSGGFWKQLVLAYNVWDTRRHRKEFKDDAGVRYYTKQLSLFCLPVRFYIQIMDLKRQIGAYFRARRQ